MIIKNNNMNQANKSNQLPNNFQNNKNKPNNKFQQVIKLVKIAFNSNLKLSMLIELLNLVMKKFIVIQIT